MGSWDSGPFDNDDAADLLADLSDEVASGGSVSSLLNEAMRAVLNTTGYLESPDVNRAVAAAACPACITDPALPAPVDPDADWRTDRTAVDDDSIALAQRVISRALQAEDNEWHDLWVEAGLLSEAEKKLQPYRFPPPPASGVPGFAPDR